MEKAQTGFYKAIARRVQGQVLAALGRWRKPGRYSYGCSTAGGAEQPARAAACKSGRLLSQLGKSPGGGRIWKAKALFEAWGLLSKRYCRIL
jgi:hypothetical protein